jgi:TRAP-type C4-dicarboxylate transport system permease small subunit
MGRAFDRLIAGLADLSGLFIAFILLSMCGEVVMRHFLNRPLSWTVEITEYLQLYIAFFSAALVLKDGGHVSLDLFVRRRKPRTRRVLKVASNLLGAVTTAIVFVFSAQTTYEAFTAGTPILRTLEAPKWLILLPLPLGFLLLTIQFLRTALPYQTEK